MSNYSQSDVIRIVESVLPEVSETGDPQGALLKKAREMNLPPSVLEKAGQVFNTAKTLNYLERVEDIEKRGATFNILDVPGLLEAYTSHEPGKSGSVSTDPANRLWAKAASAEKGPEKNDPYRFDDSWNPFYDERDDRVKSASAESRVVSHSGRDSAKDAELRKSAEERYWLRMADETRAVRDHYRNDVMKKVAGVAGEYENYYCDAPDMDRLEAECARLHRDGETVKQAFDLIQQRLGRIVKSSIGHRVKRASDETETRALVRENAYHSAVADLADSIRCLKSANEMVREYGEKAASVKNGAEDDPESKKGKGFGKNKAPHEHKSGDSQGSGGTKTKNKNTKNKNTQNKNTQNKNTQNKDTKNKDTQNKNTQNKNTQNKDTQNKDTQNKDTKNKDTWRGTQTRTPPEERYTTGDKSVDSSDGPAQKLRSLIGGFSSGVGQAANRADKNVRNYAKDIVSYSEITSNVLKHQREVDEAARYARGEAALNTLLLTDPVVSEYDEELMRDIFFTVMDVNPEAATDINQLRSILRQAGEFEGLDVQSVQTLSDLKNTRSKNTQGKNKHSEKDKDDK